MKATDIMTDEHRLIKGVLQCLAAAIDRAEQGGSLDIESIREMIEFFREFADRCHHGKEEVYFFPLARQRGVGCVPGNIDVLLGEHEEGRACVRAMDDHLTAYVKGDADAKDRLFQHARRYVQLLNEHIRKEDECLFPTANMVFSAGDDEALVRAFEEVEKNEMGVGTHQRFHTLADKLIAQWNLSEPAECSHSR